jgi:hypothetical protein
VSEHQCYEFVALDRPLTAKQLGELRALSSRAEISPTRFWSEYHWGDFKADPRTLMERYFDAHRYAANWGTRRLMLRVPRSSVEWSSLERCFVGAHAARLTRTKDHALIDLVSETDEPEEDDALAGSLVELSPLRAELMRGDMRPAYLSWLLALGAGDIDDDDEEPPCPSGLAKLTAAQTAMVEFLRIDADLVAASAQGSVPAAGGDARVRSWLEALSAKEKDAWLLRAADHPELPLGSELLRAFRHATSAVPAQAARRTARDLIGLARAERAKREEAAALRAKKAKAATEAARAERLARLAGDLGVAWSKLEHLIEASAYDDALTLAIDLRDLATQSGAEASFAQRFEALRKRQLRRRGFFDRWKRANESATRAMGARRSEPT